MCAAACGLCPVWYCNQKISCKFRPFIPLSADAGRSAVCGCHRGLCGLCPCCTAIQFIIRGVKGSHFVTRVEICRSHRCGAGASAGDAAAADDAPAHAGALPVMICCDAAAAACCEEEVAAESCSEHSSRFLYFCFASVSCSSQT